MFEFVWILVLLAYRKKFIDENLNILISFYFQFSYTAALGVTVGIGCFLLVLNMVIFAGIYYQRGRGKKRQPKKRRDDSAQSISDGMHKKSLKNNWIWIISKTNTTNIFKRTRKRSATRRRSTRITNSTARNTTVLQTS